jgi:hypothetical protein
MAATVGRRLVAAAATIGALVAALGGCGSGSGGGATAATAGETTAGETTPAEPTAPAVNTPGETPTPESSCDPAGLPPGLACQTFKSVSGTSADTDVAWLSSGEFTVSLEHVNGATFLGVGTPCNALSVPVTVEPTKLVPDKDHIATTLMACQGDAADQEHWVTQFVSQEMAYALAGTQLTLTTADSSVVFEHL